MSVTKRGRSWQVKWRDETGGQRSRTFKLKGDADAFDDEITRRKRLGPHLARQLVDRPDVITLDQFVKTGFRVYVAPKPFKTREKYQWALNLHLQELLDVPLYALDVPILSAHQTFLLEHEDNPRTRSTVREVMSALSGILSVAVTHGLIDANPVRSLQKIEADPREEIVPLSPAQLEWVILSLDGRSRIIAVLAGHLGLSPVEVRLAPWENLRAGRLLVSAARTKRQRARPRVIDVPRVTQAELRHWRLQSGAGAHGTGPIVGPLTTHALKQWGTRTLKPLLQRAARLDGSLYTLRHSHASALHYCGYTVPSAAKRMGHSPTMHLRHYAHVIDRMEGQPRHASLDDLIAWARAAAVPATFPNASENP